VSDRSGVIVEERLIVCTIGCPIYLKVIICRTGHVSQYFLRWWEACQVGQYLPHLKTTELMYEEALIRASND
jgi:hypothetical protein